MTRDGTKDEPVSRDQILRRERGQTILISRADEQDWEPYAVDTYSAISYDHTYNRLILSTCPLHTNSGCGKERRILIGPS